MKFICLGYIDQQRYAGIPENERQAMMDECFAYDDELRRKGHFSGGEALGDARSAVTLRSRGNAVSPTDGPFAETKEQLGGILVLEARDMPHAIELMSRHPGVKYGPFEIRPAADLDEMLTQSEVRRRGSV